MQSWASQAGDAKLIKAEVKVSNIAHGGAIKTITETRLSCLCVLQNDGARIILLSSRSRVKDEELSLKVHPTHIQPSDLVEGKKAEVVTWIINLGGEKKTKFKRNGKIERKLNRVAYEVNMKPSFIHYRGCKTCRLFRTECKNNHCWIFFAAENLCNTYKWDKKNTPFLFLHSGVIFTFCPHMSVMIYFIKFQICHTEANVRSYSVLYNSMLRKWYSGSLWAPRKCKFESRQWHSHAWLGVREKEVGCALQVGGAYSLCPVNHTTASQSRACVCSSMWKRATGFLCYAGLWKSTA